MEEYPSTLHDVEAAMQHWEREKLRRGSREPGAVDHSSVDYAQGKADGLRIAYSILSGWMGSKKVRV